MFGDPRLPRRFWEKCEVDPVTDCWRWIAALIRGYGRFWIGPGEFAYAHRRAYEVLVGPIPDELELDHVRVRGCVHTDCCNPTHLEPVTHAENVRRGNSAAALKEKYALQTHCERGHEFTPSNTKLNPGKGPGRRQCRACRRSSKLAWYHRQRAATA